MNSSVILVAAAFQEVVAIHGYCVVLHSTLAENFAAKGYTSPWYHIYHSMTSESSSHR